MIDQNNFMDILVIFRNEIFGSTFLMILGGCIAITYFCSKKRMDIKITILCNIFYILVVMTSLYSIVYLILIIMMIGLIYAMFARRIIGGR